MTVYKSLTIFQGGIMSLKTVFSISLLTLGVTFNARAWEGDDVEIKREANEAKCQEIINHAGRGGIYDAYYFTSNKDSENIIDIYLSSTRTLVEKKVAFSNGNLIIVLKSGCKYRYIDNKFKRSMDRSGVEYFYAKQLKLIREN